MSPIIKSGASRGFSLIEMMIVISIMGVVAVIASGFLLVSLTASHKAEITKEVRQNGNYALSVMEGMILNSLSVGCTDPSPTVKALNVRNIDEGVTSFLCDEEAGRISSVSAGIGGSVFLTGTNVKVQDCAFNCVKELGRPAVIEINFNVSQIAENARASEKATLDFQTKVITRNFQIEE